MMLGSAAAAVDIWRPGGSLSDGTGQGIQPHWSDLILEHALVRGCKCFLCARSWRGAGSIVLVPTGAVWRVQETLANRG